MQVAASSPYEGERHNALEAARRLAKKHGMSLEDAAAGGLRPGPGEQPEQSQTQSRAQSQAQRPHMSATERIFANALHLMDFHLYQEKARREAALRAAEERGLDRELKQQRLANPKASRRSRAPRIEPKRHAATLLRETELSLREIASITGLDIYQVTGLKLKMRKPAA